MIIISHKKINETNIKNVRGHDWSYLFNKYIVNYEFSIVNNNL